MKERARSLALSMLELGEDTEAIERQLHHWRFHPAVAHEAMRWALDARARADVVTVGAGPGNSMAVTRPPRPSIGTGFPGPAPAAAPGPPLDQAG
jgi:hypothetical protein